MIADRHHERAATGVIATAGNGIRMFDQEISMTQCRLPVTFRDRMESAFRQGFGSIAISVSDELPPGVGAVAWPDRICIRPALWETDPSRWARVMAHELTHVVQARQAIGAGMPASPQLEIDPGVEWATERAAAMALGGASPPATLLRVARIAPRPSILVDVSGGDGFAAVTISAINKLTHADAVRLGAAVTKYKTSYKTLVAGAAAPLADPHARSWLMVSRMLASAHECKIKASPGTDYGTAYDIEGTGDVDPGAMEVNPITMPKALRSSGARAKITWPPVPVPTFNLTDSAQGRPQSLGAVPAFIILAHEMSHADRIMRGTSLLPSKGSRNGNPASAKLAGVEGADRLPSFSVDFEHVEMVGWTADNYTCKDQDVVTENEMRAEHNIALRTRY